MAAAREATSKGSLLETPAVASIVKGGVGAWVDCSHLHDDILDEGLVYYLVCHLDGLRKELVEVALGNVDVGVGLDLLQELQELIPADFAVAVGVEFCRRGGVSEGGGRDKEGRGLPHL